MDEIARDMIVSVAAFAGIFGIVYVFLMTRNRERMTMIERGLDTRMFHSSSNARSQTLKFGMLFVGIALGILTGNLLYRKYDLDKAVAYFSMVFLLGGLSLIAHTLIDKVNKD